MIVNLPNSITAARILAAPLIAALPFVPSPSARLAAFVLYIVAAVTDYYDGKLARNRNLVTDLGRMLDPLADKLLLLATLIPMSVLMAPSMNMVAPLLAGDGQAASFPFMTPWGDVPLPWWLVLVVVSREAFMTLFRQMAARRGHVIAAIGPAKWKTGFQSTWAGAAFFWFFASTAASTYGWTGAPWLAVAYFVGLVGVTSMIGAIFLTLYSLWLYLRQYARVFAG